MKLVEFISMFNSGLAITHTIMVRAIATFFNVLVIVIIFRIFAPGLATELVRFATTIVAIANDTVESLEEGSIAGDTYVGY